MFCNGVCKSKKGRCGMLLEAHYENEKGERRTVEECAMSTIINLLRSMNDRTLALQQVSESRRNNDNRVGIAAVDAIKQGFSKMSKAVLIKENPALAILDEE